MQFNDFVDEFQADWRLAGKAATTAETYAMYLRQLDQAVQGGVTLHAAKAWVAEAASPRTARAKASAIRAFGKWAVANDGPDWSWYQRVPLASVAVTPQRTVTRDDYEAATRAATTPRDRLVVELLWSSGCRVSELTRLTFDDVSLTDRCVMVRRTKTGKPRLAPISEKACRLIRRLPHTNGFVLNMTRGAIQQLMRRLGAPLPHAWRRGWAVESLRSGVSETSLKAAAGWSSVAMVARYTTAMSAELAMSEFRRRRS